MNCTIFLLLLLTATGGTTAWLQLNAKKEIQSANNKLDDKNRQLANTNLSDTLEFDFDLDLYFDAGSASVNWIKPVDWLK